MKSEEVMLSLEQMIKMEQARLEVARENLDKANKKLDFTAQIIFADKVGEASRRLDSLNNLKRLLKEGE